MKTVSYLVKYIIIPISSLVGIAYGFHAYIIDTAYTVVEPTSARVELIVDDVREIKERTKRIESILMKRNDDI